MIVEKQSTPRYFRYILPLLKPFPNFDVPFIVPFRRQAIKHLELKKGDRVLDVGCGTGGSFPHLVDAVGGQGEVVGVEISPTVAAVARRPIQKNQWSNVKSSKGEHRVSNWMAYLMQCSCSVQTRSLRQKKLSTISSPI